MQHMFAGHLWPRNPITVAIGYIQHRVKVSSRSGQKSQIINFINVHKKVSIRCSLSSADPWCPLCCYATSETCSNMHFDYKHHPMVSLTRGRRQEALGHAFPHLGVEGTLCDCSTPSNRECVYRENVVGGRPSGALQRQQFLRKVPYDDRPVPSLGEVAPF